MRLHLVVVVVVTCLHSANCQFSNCEQRNPDCDDAWEKYKANYNKAYANSDDECNRRLIWEDKVKLIEQFNLPSSGARSYKIGLNEFSDWSSAEFSTRLTGFLLPSVERATNKPASLPENVGESGLAFLNYTDLGYVSPVKKQDCNNCYAYAAAGAMEGQLFKNSGKLVEISTQNIVDCCNDKEYGTHGCDSGDPAGVFRCSNGNGGFVTNDIYPPKGVKQICSIPEGNHTRYLCTEYFWSTARDDEESLKKFVEVVGPIVCTMYASSNTFNAYEGGVYSDSSCGTEINHAVLITGFGTTSDGVNYWIAKNSWGPDWGENGYFRILRDVNLCNIASYCTYPKHCIAV